MESELSDGDDPDYLPLSGTDESDNCDFLSDLECLSTPIKKTQNSSDAEKGSSSKENCSFSENVADDENEPEDDVQRTKKLVKKSNTTRRTIQKRSVLDFPEDADSDTEIGILSHCIVWGYVFLFAQKC